MPKIHPSAVVDPNAELAEDVEIGPFCFVEADVHVGIGCRLDSHVTLKNGTRMGKGNYVGHGAVLGGAPQDRKYGGEESLLLIGDQNIFHEYVTIHRGSGGQATEIGNKCFLLSFTHLGHNVKLGSHVTIAHNVGVSGHVIVDDHATIGGMTGIHQFVHIGRVAMIGGMSRIVRDVPPYMLVEGRDQKIYDINAIGLKRLGYSSETRLALHKACKLMFRSELGVSHGTAMVKKEVEQTPEVKELVAFVERLSFGKNGRAHQK